MLRIGLNPVPNHRNYSAHINPYVTHSFSIAQWSNSFFKFIFHFSITIDTLCYFILVPGAQQSG